MTEITNPHDRFFRETLADPKVASDFLRYYLPGEITELLDLSEAPEPMKDSYVDPELRTYFSDLLYKVRLRGERDAYVYLLMEHKSYPERKVCYQLLRYMTRIWDNDLRDLDNLQPIFPVVVYHGAATWRLSDRLQDLFDELPDALRPYTPDFRYWLCDLSSYSDDELKGEITLRVAVMALKYIFRPELPARLHDIFRLLHEVISQPTGLRALEVLLRYFSVATDQVTGSDLRRAVEETFHEEGEQTMKTIAEQWIEEGMKRGLHQGFVEGQEMGLREGLQRGLQQGLQQGLLDGIRLALELKFGFDGLALLPEIARLEDIALLRAVHEAIRFAETPEDLRKVYQKM